MKRLSVFSRIFLSVLMLLSSAPVQADFGGSFVFLLISGGAEYVIVRDVVKNLNQVPAQDQNPILLPVEEIEEILPPENEIAVPSTRKDIFFAKLCDVKDFVKANPVKTTVVLVGSGLLAREIYKNRKKIKKNLVPIVSVASAVAIGTKITTDVYKIVKAKIVKA